MNAKAVVLLLAHAAAAAAAAGAVAQTWVHQITVGTEVSGSCTPGAWVDYELVVDEAMADSNLMFEVHDLGTSYNPEALMVAIWEGAVPSDRAAEHRTERASGKVWAVGMNNECFVIGTVTLGVRCSDHVSVNFKVKVVITVAPVTVMGQAGAIIGEVCPGEWVYHYVNTSALGIYGSGKHLRYRVDKDAGEGAGVVLTRHLAAPLKTVPPYVSLDYDAQNAGNATIDMCNVEAGKQFLGILGVASEGGCMHYTLTADTFVGECLEQIHAPSDDPAAYADQTLPVEHFERASCGPHQWFDYYFPVTAHMVDVEDNIVFEVETLAEQYELGGLSVHLFQGYIPLDRQTELVSTIPDNGIYSIAIPSIELQAGPYYLSVKCGPNAQRFRTVAFEVRGKLTGPGDAVHGEICPMEWLYHSVVPTFETAAGRRLTEEESEIEARRNGRRLGRRHRRLGSAMGAAETVQPGDHVQVTFSKHEGDFIFMQLIGDHPPTRLQPPSRTMHDYDVIDYGVFCNLQPGNRYWLALLGGGHCATYDLHVSKLPADYAGCSTGEYSLVPNEVAATGLTELVKERPTYGSCTPGEYVDFYLPLTYAADSDENLRFQVELLGPGGSRPSAVSLLVYDKGEIPIDRKTEIFSDFAVDGIYSVTVNMIELKYQLCNALYARTGEYGPTCGHGSSSSTTTSSNATGYSGSGNYSGRRLSEADEEEEEEEEPERLYHRRQLGGAAAPAGGANASDLRYFVSLRCSDAGPASFKLLGTAIMSHLVNDISVHGELCPGGFVYHHWEHMAAGELKSVRFRITKHGGDGYFLVRHGGSTEEAPLKLAPPYLHLYENDDHAFIEYCNASAAVGDNPDHVYVMLVGGDHCMSYEIMAMEEPNEECLGMHGAHEATSYYDTTGVAPHHFVYSSCANNDWVDFHLDLEESDFHYNYLIEVEDLTEAQDPTALALYMFESYKYNDAGAKEYYIPEERTTEQRSELAIDGIYSLAINQHNFHAGRSYLSVNCRDVGDTPRRFRMVIFQIEEYLTLGKEYHGEVSPGQWVYHSYTVPSDGSPHNFTFHLVKHTGDLEIVVRHDYIPLKLVPPFVHVGENETEKDTQVCNSLPGEKVYLGMLGGGHAASYEIIASELPVGAPCTEPPHTTTSVSHENMHHLRESKLTLGHCEAGGWYFYDAEVSEYDMKNNLIFELEDLGHTGTQNAVTVSMFAAEIPLSRKSEYFTDRAYDDVYSLSVSMHEFEPFLDVLQGGHHRRRLAKGDGAASGEEEDAHSHFEVGGPRDPDDAGPEPHLPPASHRRLGGASSSSQAAAPGSIHTPCTDEGNEGQNCVSFYFGVLCGPRAARFRAFYTFVKSTLDTHHAAHGEVCPDEWVYHKLTIDAALVAGPHDGGDGHRRLASVTAWGEAGEQPLHPSRRALASSSGSDREDGVHVKMHIVKNQGAMNLVKPSLNDKPLRLIPSDTIYMMESDEAIDLVICDVDYFYRNHSGSSLMWYYLAINGGDTCAHYEVFTSTFTTSCAAAQAAALVPVASTVSHGTPGNRECPQDADDCILSMRHYMRASCAPQERAPPFVIEIPYADGQVLDNLVIECEDLNDAENPNSLEVALYAQDPSVCGADLCTHEQLSMLTPMRTTSLARKRIFSFGVSSIEMQAMVCAADKCSCTRAAGCSFKLSLVVRCAGTPVRFRVISILTQLALEPGVPVHGEVCPGNWIYHKARIPAAYKEQYGLRFHVHVHEGDVYYVISRWERTPGFAACNENEYAMSFMSDGHADLCDIPTATTNWGGPYEDPSSTSDLLPGYVGLYGGTSCAHYTISTEWLDANSNCSVATTGTCRKRNT